MLCLAYGCTFRSREIDDGNGRKAPRKEDRNWRVLLRETYGLGDRCAIVLATQAARSAKGNAIRFLLSEGAKCRAALLTQEAIGLLIEARKAFAAVYEPSEEGESLQVETKRKRGRPSAGDSLRLSAFFGAHGREIGG